MTERSIIQPSYAAQMAEQYDPEDKAGSSPASPASLPADGAFPVFYPLTGVGYAWSADQQKLWQADVNRFESKLLASMAKRIQAARPPSHTMKAYTAHNPFMSWLK